MNFLSHAIPYLDSEDSFFVAGTAIPDWLSVVDRKIRARRRRAELFLEDDDPAIRGVARGIVAHVRDDGWFHSTRCFAETNLMFAIQLRDLLPGDAGFRPTFVGHIVIEMLLDALWIEDDPSVSDRYYQMLGDRPPVQIQDALNVITGKPTENLAKVIDRFIEIRFLYDYLDDEKLLHRLNQVMNRVKLAPLPDSLLHWLADARTLVRQRRPELFTPTDEQS